MVTYQVIVPSNDAIGAQYEEQHLLPFRNSLTESARFVNENESILDGEHILPFPSFSFHPSLQLNIPFYYELTFFHTELVLDFLLFLLLFHPPTPMVGP